MNIYDAISGDPLTPQKLLQIKKEEAQKQYQDALTPNDKVKLETKITNTVNNIKNDQFEYQKSLLSSPVTSNKLAKEYEDKTSDMIIKVDEESNPLFDMSTDQYKVYSNMIANSSDIDKTKNDLDSALLFSNILGISLEEAYQNKDQLAAQYGKGRWGNNPNMFEDLKTSFSIGAKSSKASKLGNNLVKLEAKAEGLEGEELTKQEGLIQETLDQIDELNSYIDTHSSYLDDGIGRKLLRGFGTNAPQMGEVLAYSAAIGATIATAGVALPIIAGTTAALGTSALVGAGSLSVFGAALTTMLKSKELTKGSMYVDLRKKGISAKTARDTADIVGSFTGFTEVAFDAIPMGFVKTIFGKSVGNKVLSSFVQKLAINPALSKILLTSGEAIKSGAGEGVQEFVQSLAETIGTYMAESIEENGASTLYEGFSKLDKDDLNKAYADAAMGFGLGLMMGSPSYIYNAHFDIKQYNELKGIASNTDSKADFVKKGAKITPKTEHNTLGDLFDKFKKKEEKTKVSDIISPDLENIKNTSKVGEEEILTPKKKKQETSTKVELSPRSRNVKLKGNNITETAVFDSNKKKAGNITFLNKNDSIEVVGIDINNTNLIKSTMQEIIAKYPNKEVIWDTNNDVDLDLIKDELIDENPRGEEFGLSYYNFSTEDSEIASKIKKPFNLNNEQAVVATSLVKLHAKKEGLSVSQWMDKNIESIKSVGLDSNKRGGIKINQSKKGIKAVIYTARNSDFSTFTHEVFHLSISQMDNKGDLAGYIKNWAKNEEFITFYNENKNIFDADFETTLKAAQEFDPNNDNWTTRQEELAASIYETWLKQGTTNVPELDSLMSKISEWFKEIYKSVKSTVKVNDDVSSFFDSMYSQDEEQTPTTTDEIESSTKKEVKDIVNEIVPAKEETVKSPEVETNQQNIDKHNAEVISKQTDEDVIKEMIEAGKKFNPNVDTSKVLYQTTFQGTVYEFEKHSMDYVGKGEGTQFFGWGMYVSQSDTVARGYAIRAYDEKHKEFYKTNDEKVEDIIKKSKTYSTTRDMFQDLINYKFFDKKTKEESIQEEKELIDDNENNIKYLEGFLLDNNDKEDVNSLLEEIEDFKKTISFLNKKIDFINKYYDSLVKSSNGIDHRVLYNIEIPDEGYINWTEKLPDDFADRFHDIMVNHGFDGDDASVIIENAINRKRTKYITSNNNTTEVSGTLETFHRNITIDDYFNEDYSQESINTSVLTPKQTSMFLSEMGYKGIKYPIGSVHGNGHNKKSNFVIFNADDMKITNKTLFQSEQSTKETDEKYLNAVKNGDMETVQSMVDDAISEAVKKGIEILPPDDDITGFKYHKGELPKKTKKSYAVFVANENGIEAAFAGKDGTVMPFGIWLDAEEIEGITSTTKKFSDGTFKKYIPGSTGATAKDAGINPTEYGLPKGQKFLFFRPGKHSSSLPNFSQMNVKDKITGKKQSAMPNNKIIFEIEIPVDVDFTDQMLEEAPKHPTTGKPMMRDAGLQRLPREGGKEGSYDYKTNPNAKGTWRISSAFKINRLVPYSEIISKNEEAGIDVPKWNDGYTPEKYGLTEESVQQEATRVKKLADPIAYDSDGNVIPLSQRFQPDNKTLFQSENRDLKKLNKDNSISVDENNEIISVNLVDSRGDRWLFQQKTKYKERKDAVIIASKMNSVVEFKDLYSENSKKHTDKWYENVFKDGLELAASEAVETLYYGEDTKTKNNIFSNSLKSDSLIDGFIRQLKVLKRDVEDISQKDKLMLDDKMKIDFYKEITDVIPEEIMNKTRLSKKSREEIRNINTEDSSSLRNIYARLFGIEYMTDDGIFADVDYFEDTSDLVEANKITMAKALTNFSEPETKKRLRENYKKALTDMETHTKKLKEEISSLKEKNQKQIDKLKENKEANKKQIAEIKAKQKEDIKKLRADYEAKLKEKDNVAYYKALKKNINRNIPESIRDDYARDIKAIQVLFNGTARNSFKTLNGERWSPKLVKDIIEKNMGEMFSDMFDEDFLQDLADSNATEKEALYSTDELEFFNLLANKLRDKGYELRKQDKLERKERNSDIRDALSEGLDSSYKRVKNTLPNKFYEKLSPVRLVFSATMNIERKAVLLDGFNKKGPYQSLLLDKRRELSSQKVKRIDERMKKVTDVMDKNKVSLIDLSKSVYETKFGGEIQKHSIADLFYYYYSLQNNDNIMAVSCGLLMTKGERRDTTNISDEDFFEKAETRYKDVVEKSLEYVNNPKYSEIFDTIWKEFNNDSIDKINSILLKTLNKQVRVVKNYLPLVRRNFANKEVQDQFEQDIEGRQYYDTNTTKYGALTERQKIAARNQEPINTNMLSLLQDSVEKQEHLLAFYDYVKDLKYIFLSKDSISLKNNILEKYGDEMFEDIETFIQEVANPYASRSEGRIDQLAEVLTGNLYPSYLGLKTSTIMMQFITSPAAFNGKMNIPEFLGSFLNTLTHKKKVIKKVNELSPFMKNRAWDYSWADIKKVLKQYNGNKNSKILKYEKFLEFSMGGLQIADQMTVYSGWMQLYKTELERLQIENSSASINENTKLAVKYADDYVRKTQPNSDVVEVAQMFKGGAASKIFTRFTASLSPIYQNLTFDSYQLWKNKDYKELFGLISGYAIVGGLLYAIKGGYDKSDDGEEKFKKLLYSFMSQGASSVPIIGNLVDYTFKSIITGEKSGLFFTNLLPPVESILEAQRKFSDSDFMEGVQSMAEGIGIFAGFPISATKEYYSAIKEKSLLPLLGNKK